MPLSDLPDNVKWKLSIGGHAWSPGQVALVAIATPLFTLAGIATAMAPVINLIGVPWHQITLSLTTAPALLSGTVTAGLSVAATATIIQAFKEVSDKLFVPW